MNLTAATAKYPVKITARDLETAITIAEIITGTHDFNGGIQTDNKSGLVALVQEYIDSEKTLKKCGIIAHEIIDNSGISTYYAGYKE